MMLPLIVPVPADDHRPLRVVLVDDHVVMRRSTRRLLEAAGGIEVVGEAAHGGAVPGVVDSAAPDVVVMDLRMPGVDGLEATRLLRRARPEVQVLVLTTSTDDDDLVEALVAGAVGYVTKDAGRAELVAAVLAAGRGEPTFSPGMAARLALHVRGTAPSPAPPSADAGLDERDRELLRRLALGQDNATIARALHLSPHTVKGDVSALLARLGLSNRVQAAVWAVRHGVADP